MSYVVWKHDVHHALIGFRTVTGVVWNSDTEEFLESLARGNMVYYKGPIPPKNIVNADSEIENYAHKYLEDKYVWRILDPFGEDNGHYFDTSGEPISEPVKSSPWQPFIPRLESSS